MAIWMISSHKLHNNTVPLETNYLDAQFHVAAALWVHIILMTAASIFMLPMIIVFRDRNHPWYIACRVATVISMVLGTAATYVEKNGLLSSSHGAMGYIVIFLVVAYLFNNVWHRRSSIPRLTNKVRLVFQHVIFAVLPILFYVEILLGVITLLGFCSSPYTQQCFGHLGIGSLYLLYFSFWAALVHNAWVISHPMLTSEVLDAAFLVPSALGLSRKLNTDSASLRRDADSVFKSIVFGHAWGYPWDDESVQHVAVGIFGLLATVIGTFSRDLGGKPKRNIFPGLVSHKTYLLWSVTDEPRSPV
ncbi:uncharacterized protein LY89DRAFT_670144 [Mollisia scopiformis]|uniref:DUF2427 domain-containing protein n=1 Tax=Mollisia scopiformis TaxID=149040 RepID=A0A194X712_MOLSC|nr:uncharacterized protein LY89DRAFT_670144 [Mollisia scopiformis]KUJ15592.1 hypothetical protein LY89DRAFT_670144 [Mollisia scopiformis]